MCIRRETREKARRSLAFSRVSKPHTHITHMLRQCTSIVYEYNNNNNINKNNNKTTTISGRDVLYTTLCDKVGQ